MTPYQFETKWERWTGRPEARARLPDKFYDPVKLRNVVSIAHSRARNEGHTTFHGDQFKSTPNDAGQARSYPGERVANCDDGNSVVCCTGL